MGRTIKLSPDNKQSSYEQKTRAVTKRDFTVLKRRTDELNGISTELSTLINQNADAILLRATKTEVNSIEGRVTTAEGSITTIAGQVAIKANQSTVDTLTGRVSTAESSIVTNANNITLKVSETAFNGDNIIGKINLSSTTAEINASKINLTGYVTVTNLSTAGQTTINGGNITTGTINANNVTVTNLNASSITAGTLNVDRIPTLNANKINVTELSALGATIAGFSIGSYPSYTGNAIYSGSGSSRVGVSPGVTTGGYVYSFWAGSDNPINAPFRVLRNGGLRASGAVISGDLTTSNLNASSGTIGGASFSSVSGGLNLNGSIRVTSLYSGSTSANYLYGATYFYADAVTYNVRPSSTNSYYLGTTNFRWSNIWQTSGSVTGSDRKLKEDILDIENGVDFILSLKPRQYKLKDGKRMHYGFIAQEVKESLTNNNIKDVGVYVDPFVNPTEQEIEEFEKHGTKDATLALRYEEFIAPMVQTIQDLNSRVNYLEGRII